MHRASYAPCAVSRTTRWLLGAAGLVLAAASPSGAETLTSTASSAAATDHRVLIESLQGRLDTILGRLDRVADKVSVLRETALGGDVAQTRAFIVHKNELGSAFVLERARYLLDGGVLLDRTDSNGNLSSIDELVLYDGRIGPGDHLIDVELVCRGGGFGLFSYVESYRFRVTSKYVFQVREGRTNRLEVTAFQKPDITLEAAQRLTVRYDAEVLTAPKGVRSGGESRP